MSLIMAAPSAKRRIQNSPQVNEYLANLISLVHFNGANGSTSFPDVTSKTWTRVNATVSTAQWLFGGASGFFNSNSAIYSATNAGDAFGTGDAFVEIAGYFTALGTNIIIDFRVASDNDTKPAIYNVGTTLHLYVSGANRISATSALTTNTWLQIAWSRKSGVSRLFVQGNQVGPTWADTTNYNNNRIVLGSNRLFAGNFVSGYLDEFRVQKNVGISSNYTPATSQFPDF